MRFHILAVPHTISTPEYSSCAFTQKVVKLCKMLTRDGHHVIHYGHQDSEVECAEHVTVVRRYDLDKSYKDHDWRQKGWPQYNEKTDWAYKVFYAKANAEILCRKEPGDFLLLTFGVNHKPVADENMDMIICESGIGYPDGGYAKYRVFESHSILSAYRGQKSISEAHNDFWFDAVIPNCFDISQFRYTETKNNYFLFLGRVNPGKGIHIAEQISKATGTPLIVAGAGQFEFDKEVDVTRVGVVGPEHRAELLRNAKALLCPSTFMEPFCGVQVEAFLSGTPVISSDWGAFTEYNLHGKTGFRCKTFEHFEWAARNIERIESKACRDHGLKFSLENVSPLYDEYFTSVHAGEGGPGWYAPNAGRLDMKHTSFGV